MTLKEMKENIMKLIEEASTDTSKYTDDPDLDAKLNSVVNQVMFELSRIKKIPKKETKEIEETGDFDLKTLTNFFQLDHLKYVDEYSNELNYDLFGNIVNFDTKGTATIYYYVYPERITEDTDDETYKFELSEDALEVLPYGVAADLLKSDVSASYGQVYSNRYEQMLQRLDPRYSTESIYIETIGVI